MEKNETRAKVSFAAIDPGLQVTIPSPKEVKYTGREWVTWGEDNLYPYYLLSLYNNVPTLRSIINGTVDFITGDDVTAQPLPGRDDLKMNDKGETARDLVRKLARDFEIYGGFAVEVIRNLGGEVAALHYMDVRFLRCDEENEIFRYSEKWDKGGRRDVLVYPAFREDAYSVESSVVYVKNEHTQVYPAPLYAASVRDCEIERNITDFHLNALENGFVSSVIVNMNNGQPDDRMQEEIERGFTEKFTGHSNAGRVCISWNDNKEHETTITEPKVEDFGERYKALSTHARQQIFSAFRAVPALFGIMTESTGFNEQEFEQAFRLYNRTQVRPVQRLIADTFDRIYGSAGVLTIVPFSLEGETEKIVK